MTVDVETREFMAAHSLTLHVWLQLFADALALALNGTKYQSLKAYQQRERQRLTLMRRQALELTRKLAAANATQQGVFPEVALDVVSVAAAGATGDHARTAEGLALATQQPVAQLIGDGARAAAAEVGAVANAAGEAVGDLVGEGGCGARRVLLFRAPAALPSEQKGVGSQGLDDSVYDEDKEAQPTLEAFRETVSVTSFLRALCDGTVNNVLEGKPEGAKLLSARRHVEQRFGSGSNTVTGASGPAALNHQISTTIRHSIEVKGGKDSGTEGSVVRNALAAPRSRASQARFEEPTDRSSFVALESQRASPATAKLQTNNTQWEREHAATSKQQDAIRKAAIMVKLARNTGKAGSALFKKKAAVKTTWRALHAKPFHEDFVRNLQVER
jgi:hypothetical protein